MSRAKIPRQQSEHACVSAGRPSGDERSSLKVGGTTLSAPSAEILANGITQLSEAVDRAVGCLPSLDRRSILHLVRESLGTDVENRVFGAILGSRLRVGKMDAILCAASSYKTFWIYVAADNLPAFRMNVDAAQNWLKEARTVSATAARHRFFPKLDWGAWSAAFHLLARLAFIGAAQYGEDGKSFTAPLGLEDAIES